MTERGFVLKRTFFSEPDYSFQDIIQTDSFKLETYDTPFVLHISDYMSDAAKCEAYAYAKLNNKLYRSPSVWFDAGGETQAEISSVKVYPVDEGVEGTVVIEGKNFSKFDFRNRLEVDTSWITPAYAYFTLREKEFSSTRLVFDYICCQVGEAPLRLTIGNMSTRLDTPLKVEGAHFLGFNPSSPRVGEEVEVLMEHPNKNTYYTLLINHEPCPFTNNKTVFYNLPQQDNVLLYYEKEVQNYYHKIYSNMLPITFSCPWVQAGSLSIPAPRTTSEGWVYATDGERLYARLIAGGEMKSWPIYSNGIKRPPVDMDSRRSCDLCADGDNVYLSVPAVGKDDWYTVLLHFNRTEESWEILAWLPYSSELHIAQSGHRLLIALSYFDIIVYQLDNHNWTRHEVTYIKPYWVGTYRNSFYFIKQVSNGWQCYRINADGTGQTQPIGPTLPFTVNNMDPKQIQIENGYLYVHPPIARLSLNKNNAVWEHLGAPASTILTGILPSSNDVYCIDIFDNLYRFEDDRK